MSMSIDQGMALKEFAERYAAAWCSQDAALVASFYGVAGSLRVNGGDPAVGRDAIEQVARSFMTTFPDMKVSFDELRFESGLPQFHWTLTGTNDGPEGTGHFVRVSGYERWVLGNDGLISHSEGHFDGEDYARQLRGER